MRGLGQELGTLARLMRSTVRRQGTMARISRSSTSGVILSVVQGRFGRRSS